MTTSPDHLPPNSPEAERGLLGCCIDDAGLIAKLQGSFRGEQPFYDIRHELVWNTLVTMSDQKIPITVESVWQYLRDTARAEDAGGLGYLVEIHDATPSSEMWSHWREVVWEKWLARRILARYADTAKTIRHTEISVGAMIDASLKEFMELDEMRRSLDDAPPRIKRPDSFGEDVWQLWFGKDKGEPGHELPFGFPWKIRTAELTLAIGEKGKGKTTLVSYLMLHMLRRGMKAFIASMEMRPEITLKILMSQLLGTKYLDDTEENQKRFRSALAWLQQRVVIYDFLGAVNYEVLLQAMEHASKKLGCDFMLIDSLMRLGIADDDYAGQGLAVLRLANHAVEHKCHTVLINHLNKSEGNARARNRGSGQIVDNAFNVVAVERNEKKWEKLDEKKADMHRQVITPEEYADERRRLSEDWDAKIYLYNQRWPGSTQNGVKQLWFEPEALQYAETPNPDRIDYLDRWTKHPPRKETQP